MKILEDNANSRPGWINETIEQTRDRLRRPWGDYPLTILIINPVNLRLVRMIGRTSITPNQISILSFIIIVLSAILLSSTGYFFHAAGGILLLVSYIVDCLDGDLARYKSIESPLGAMLDSILDRCGDFAVILGVTINGWRLYGDVNWLIGGFVLVGMSQIYFYITDGILNKVISQTRRPELSRRPILRGTKIIFGAYEPFMWGQAVLALAGMPHWGVPIFALMFTLSVPIQTGRVIFNAKHLTADKYNASGPHVWEEGKES
jgi:hypothetical protein